jgi:hypothetical protein
MALTNLITINTSTGVLSTDSSEEFADTLTVHASNSEGSTTATVSVTVAEVTTVGYFVATTGSNTTGNGSFANPWQTIAFGASQLVPGDTLNIMDGSYGGFTCPVSGTQALPITIQGYPGARPLIDGRVSSGDRGTIHITAKDWLIFRNLDVIEGQPDCIYYEGTSGQQHGNILFEDVYAAHCNNSGFFICGLVMGQTIPQNTYRTINITIRDCEVEDTNRTAPPGNECISVGGGVDGIIIEDCWIHDSNRYGVDLKLGCRNGIIRRNLIHDMTNHGIYLDAASRTLENVWVYDNEVYDCGANGITIAREADREPGAQDIRNVWVWNNTFGRCRRGILVYRHVWDTAQGDFDNVNLFHNTMADSVLSDFEFADDSSGNTWSAAVITNFHFHNNLSNGGDAANINEYASTSGYSASNNVSSNPTFTNRAATPPNLRIPVGSTADGAGSASWLPATVLAGANAWFLANATVANVDKDGDAYASPPASGAYEAQ